ncbi:MAG TPA: hypothetical protein VFI06_12225 [Chitinophagaceae bacterium]|nr:hypothetical protein [Chitinophagaceae bacterium]
MKEFGLFLLIIFAHFAGWCQSKTIKWYNKELQSFVQPAHGRYIGFTKGNEDPLRLRPDSTTTLSDRLYSVEYDMQYLGHRWLFERQFDSFPETILLDKLESLKDTSYYYNFFDGRIYRDSIIITRTKSYRLHKKTRVTKINVKTNEEDEKIFLPLDRKIKYPGGKEAFQKFLQTKLVPHLAEFSSQPDSAFYFLVVVRRDSTIGEVKLLEPGHPSAISKRITAALKEMRGWNPAKPSGLDVNVYKSMFVRLRRDGTIEADYDQYY